MRNLLVSNAEYARFLNALAQAGHAEQPRRHLPAGLRDAARTRRTAAPRVAPRAAGTVSPGYEHHPAYWVTWIGAAAFAAWDDARLPTTSRTDRADTDGAAVGRQRRLPVRRRHPRHRTWPRRRRDPPSGSATCKSGAATAHPPAGLDGPAARWLHGAAWNTPATATEMQRPRHRHLLGCSRGVGIRLVRDGTQAAGHAGELARPADRVDRQPRRTGPSRSPCSTNG